MPKRPKKGVNRISVDCIFRGRGRSREFTAIRNCEAVNLLKNKLDKLGLANKRGKLIFQFKW